LGFSKDRKRGKPGRIGNVKGKDMRGGKKGVQGGNGWLCQRRLNMARVLKQKPVKAIFHQETTIHKRISGKH